MDEAVKKEQKESDGTSELAPEELDQVAGGLGYDVRVNGDLAVIRKPAPQTVISDADGNPIGH